MNMKKIKVKILLDIPLYKAGETALIFVTQEGIPISRFWRRRFKDAKSDHCLEIVTEKEIPKEPKVTKTKRGED